MIIPIQTTYNGTRYRSRTEARWAVFFDLVGINFIYEPEGYVVLGKPYLPDFFLPDVSMFFEVKGQAPTEKEKNLCAGLWRSTKHPVYLAEGDPALNRGKCWGRYESENVIQWENDALCQCRYCGGWLLISTGATLPSFEKCISIFNKSCSICQVGFPDYVNSYLEKRFAVRSYRFGERQ